jgi:dihydrofolate reductase
VLHSFADALAASTGVDEVFVCGGEELYRMAIPMADRIYLTVVHRFYPGDTFFPPIPSEFIVAERRDAGFEALCSFILYLRKQE